jgi:thiol-disulfide isomerase/thioredoxin
MMTPGTRAIFRVVVAAALLAGATLSLSAQSPGDDAVQESASGTWTGTAQVNGRDVPFQLEISGADDEVQGALVNGKERSAISSGSYSDGHLVLHFDYYANTLDATLRDGVLTGTFGGHAHSIPIAAHLNGKLPAAAANPPRISGVWDVAVENGSKGEHSWKLRVRQTGSNVDAVVERIDGDTGNLYGVWRDGVFAVSHFTAAGPCFAVLRPQADGTLQLETAAHGGGVEAYTAHRVTPVHTVALETLDDPLHHTSLENPNEPLAFRFPDLNGRLVSNTDPEFAHKALIVSVGGSWCPNCQDEAPFLEALYRRYHSRGLEIVELSFEEASQLQNPVRLRAVIQRYGITYSVLVAGTPDQLNEKIAHVRNLNCWPTTFFVGKDGLVKAIHTGYAGPATAGDNRDLEKETTTLVERLLAGKESPERSKPVQVARTQ